jgi:TonB family protein
VALMEDHPLASPKLEEHLETASHPQPVVSSNENPAPTALQEAPEPAELARLDADVSYVPPYPLDAPYGFPAHPVLRHWKHITGALLLLGAIVSGTYVWQNDASNSYLQSSLGGALGALPVAASGSDVAGELPVRVSVSSAPAGATIFLDLDSIGVTPLRNYPLASGAYILSVRSPDQSRIDTVIYVEEGEFTYNFSLIGGIPTVQQERTSGRLALSDENPVRETVTPSIPPVPRTGASGTTATNSEAGTLLVVSEPTGGAVYLDNMLVGETPYLSQSVAPGLHNVSIELAGYGSYTQDVDLTAGETTKVTGQLGALTGTLSVLVQPWGTIYIDGRMHRQDTDVQYRVDLPVGSHQVRVVHPTLGTWQRTVEIEGGATQQVNVLFQTSSPPVETSTAVSTPDTQAQEPAAPELTPDASGIYPIVEEPPQLLGNLQDLYRLAQYPPAAYNARLEGRVYLRFVVDEAGRVSNATVTRSLGMGTDEEALRLIRQARFTPGKVDGVPVKSWHSFYIVFQIPE